MSDGLTIPIRKIVSVTPSDTVEFELSRAIYVGTSGNVNLVDELGNEIILHGLAAGIWHPIRTKKILNTSTTASNIRVGY